MFRTRVQFPSTPPGRTLISSTVGQGADLAGRKFVGFTCVNKRRGLKSWISYVGRGVVVAQQIVALLEGVRFSSVTPLKTVPVILIRARKKPGCWRGNLQAPGLYQSKSDTGSFHGSSQPYGVRLGRRWRNETLLTYSSK